MAFLARFLTALPLLILSPLVMAISALAMALADLWWGIVGSKLPGAETRSRRHAATVVIPTWNGRDLLARYIPYLEAALAANEENEILVVDNGSTDGSVEFLRENHPRVKTLALDRNLGFGGGSNAGFRAAANDIVVLLNNDMRVEPDFLAPLLAGFTDDKVFAVSCQIFFSDPDRVREETGLTQGWWEDGSLRVRHRIDEAVSDLYPCFYGGGGSCAFDRKKFLELGGFDSLLAPFYLEDTDLGYLAWKRGWKVLYQPQSKVYHEHRGTIGKRFTERQIQAVLKKNFILFCWKNIHAWDKLISHLFFTYAGALVSLAFGDEPGRANLVGLWRAFSSLPQAVRSRWQARSLAVVDDAEAFRRPLGGYFRDRFDCFESEPERLSVLFVSPYPICPPTHGGGLFMYQTIYELARMCDVHVVILLDRPDQLGANQALGEFCASTEFLLRMEGHTRYLGSIVPHAVREFQNDDLAWRIHRQIYMKKVDVLQLEYTPLGQYAGAYRRIPSILFEHDIYFQSIGRALEYMRGTFEKLAARFEYLRAIRYELRMLPACDRVQVCTQENKEYLASFLPQIRGKLQEGLRAGIDTSRYDVSTAEREPDTMLFLCSFRHTPNAVALEWFARKVMPHIRASRPRARVVVIGADPPPRYAYEDLGDAVEFVGFVEDIREALARYAVFVCPILNGSGVRVKLLEAFAAGIPAVSTYIGAEGLARKDGEFCLLADDPEQFAQKTVWLFENPEKAAGLAQRARCEVIANWDMAVLTRRLEESYREAMREKRRVTSPSAAS
jgi:GT2 family glycosyltransferase/glycosyltransferase involved in cell wall biosynthesis